MDNAIYQRECEALRQELVGLKSCQITFLTASVTATSALLGAGVTVSKWLDTGTVIFLLPLTVLLPFWWVFFDKATTITRIVGYFRILEGLQNRFYTSEAFVGWENGLVKFRNEKPTMGIFQQYRRMLGILRDQISNRGDLGEWLWQLLRILTLDSDNKYWAIAHYTFMALSVVCLSMYSLLTTPGTHRYWLSSIGGFALFSISLIYNTTIIWQLNFGRHSYNCNEKIWKNVLVIHGECPTKPPTFPHSAT